ncbi:RNA polymerase sigma factor [Chitinophaga sp.]|uniref:RNA polymerase sigma factor n=1 Tax=Chitinophaga sp. TaxID=1869181 RepID=UPI0031CE4EA0
MAAYEYLYDRYAGALFNIILGIIEDEATGADVLQDTLIKIWRNIDHFDPEKGKLFTWMHSIARNTALDMVRSKYYQYSRLIKPVAGNVMELASPDHTHHHYGLWELIGHLKKDQSILIDLCYIQGYTQQEIAEKLNIPLGTVKTRLGAALKALKKLL